MRKPQKVLVVEDETSLNEAYQITLKKEGYEVYAAFDGHQALEIVTKVEPDLILLDVRMPGKDGIEFLRDYRDKFKDSSAKIVVFSNLDQDGQVDQAYDLGADKYILKALAAPKDLVKLVKSILAQN